MYSTENDLHFYLNKLVYYVIRFEFSFNYNYSVTWFLNNIIPENTIIGKYNIGKSSWESIISNGKIWIYKITTITLTALILLYTAIFMYGSFYFAFIPVVAHEVFVLFLWIFAQKCKQVWALQFHQYFFSFLQHARHHYIWVSNLASKHQKNVGTSMQVFHWICYLDIKIKVIVFHNLNYFLYNW